MTESRWLRSNDGIQLFNRIWDRLSARKMAFFDEMRRTHELRRGASSKWLAEFCREQLGNPFRPYTFDPAWRTETVLALAAGVEAERAFDRMPILADALEEAGCDERAVLDHLRGPGPHARGCWVLDLILNREPELFALPPLVPTPSRMQLGPFTPPPEGMA